MAQVTLHFSGTPDGTAWDSSDGLYLGQNLAPLVTDGSDATWMGPQSDADGAYINLVWDNTDLDNALSIDRVDFTVRAEAGPTDLDDSITLRADWKNGTGSLAPVVTVLGGATPVTTFSFSHDIAYLASRGSAEDRPYYWRPANGGCLQLNFSYGQNMGADGTYVHITEVTAVITYTPKGPVPSSGSASGSWSFTGTASGTAPLLPPSGSATGGFAFTGTATGSVRHVGLAEGAVSWSGAATGSATHSGSASGAHSWTGTASGTSPVIPPNAGSASGTWSFTGSASGSTAHSGQAAGSHSWTGAADGSVTTSGSASGAHSWTGAANGSTAHSGTASGGFSFTGSASGTTPVVGAHSGSASGGFSFTGTASGSAVHEGTATGSHTWTGSADGSTRHSGTAVGEHTWTGDATGTTRHSGSASGGFAFTGSATGIQPTSARDLRLISLTPPQSAYTTVGPAVDLVTATAPGEAWAETGAKSTWDTGEPGTQALGTAEPTLGRRGTTGPRSKTTTTDPKL